MKNYVIENNTFKDCRTPEFSWGDDETRPLFRNNTYKNVERRDGHAVFTIGGSSDLVKPEFEEVQINASAANAVVALQTGKFPDGQTLKVTGGSTSRPVKFATGQASYTVSQDQYLTGTDTLWFVYRESTNKWAETNIPTSIARQHPAPAIDAPNLTLSRIAHQSFMLNLTVPHAWREQPMSIRLFNPDGKLVRTLFDATASRSSYALSLSRIGIRGAASRSGQYVVRIEGAGKTQMRSFPLL
jgi:hypothetical protein